MWPPPTISDYYRLAIEKLKAEIESTPDDRVIGISADEWVDYLVRKYGMVPIMFDDSRQQEMSEIQAERVQRGYNIYDDSGPVCASSYPLCRPTRLTPSGIMNWRQTLSA